VASKCRWKNANQLSPDDPLVDSCEAWADHYRWYPQHCLMRRSRYSLKADPGQSFQPQAASGALIDIMPCLAEHGIRLDSLQAGMRAGTGSQPMTIPVPAGEAIAQAVSHAPITLRGAELRRIRLPTRSCNPQTEKHLRTPPPHRVRTALAADADLPVADLHDGRRVSVIRTFTLWDASRAS